MGGYVPEDARLFGFAVPARQERQRPRAEPESEVGRAYTTNANPRLRPLYQLVAGQPVRAAEPPGG